MIFNELYSAYYKAVSEVIRTAADHKVSAGELRHIVEENAFSESVLAIEPALREQRWQLLYEDGSTPLTAYSGMPVTELEKRWLRSLYTDPRIRLFSDDLPSYLEDVQPLFRYEDICVFDRYSDGDPYDDEGYISRFRLILASIHSEQPLEIYVRNRHDEPIKVIMLPKCLEYSEKDDKFRLIGECTGLYVNVVNLGRIISCSPYNGSFTPVKTSRSTTDTLEFDLYDSRNALERVLMHFAHFEKQVIKTASRRYHVILRYDRNDETELLIRILSFGPLVKVTAPKSFILLIKMRLERQKKYIPAANEESSGN